MRDRSGPSAAAAATGVPRTAQAEAAFTLYIAAALFDLDGTLIDSEPRSQEM